MRSWHDFNLIGYAIDGKRQELIFELEWPSESKTGIRNAKVCFSGVECYYLEHDLGINIVYAIEEAPLSTHLEEWTDCFETECKYGWPKFWRPRPYPPQPVSLVRDEALALLGKRNVKCFYLSTSYGLSGWVLATEIRESTIEA